MITQLKLTIAHTDVLSFSGMQRQANSRRLKWHGTSVPTTRSASEARRSFDFNINATFHRRWGILSAFALTLLPPATAFGNVTSNSIDEYQGHDQHPLGFTHTHARASDGASSWWKIQMYSLALRDTSIIIHFWSVFLSSLCVHVFTIGQATNDTSESANFSVSRFHILFFTSDTHRAVVVSRDARPEQCGTPGETRCWFGTPATSTKSRVLRYFCPLPHLLRLNLPHAPCIAISFRFSYPAQLSATRQIAQICRNNGNYPSDMRAFTHNVYSSLVRKLQN